MPDGFRVSFNESIRADGGDKDWSQFYVDYALFKRRLAVFSERRAKLRTLMDASRDGRISEDDFYGICGSRSLVARQQKMIELTGLHCAGEIESEEAYFNLVTDSSSEHSMSSPYISGDDNSYVVESRSNNRIKKRYVMPRITAIEREELRIFIKTEVDKCAGFYHTQWQALSEKLTADQASDMSMANRQSRYDSQKAFSFEILELAAFCVTNVMAIRQVLIRYDAFVRTYGGSPMLEWYMKKLHRRPRYSSFRTLLHHEELNAIVDSFRNIASRRFIMLESMKDQLEAFKSLLDKSAKKEKLASRGHVPLKDTFWQILRSYFLLGNFADSLGLEPTFLLMRGASLTDEMKQIADWRKSKAPILPNNDDVQKGTLSCSEIFALTLNLIAIFLYCMNYYIVEPSSTKYVNYLGGHDAMSGLLIGMMPWAASISSVFYSYWTNQTFRQPILCSSVLMVTGNLIYGCAYDQKSLGMALVGRFMTGLGAPKCIVRRYMADTTPLIVRTSVNAAFGMMVAVGSAMGPASAVFLDKLKMTFYFKRLDIVIHVNGMTGTGFFMASLWATLTLLILLFFSEPERKGLAEQKQQEATKSTTLEEVTTSEKMDRGNNDGNIELKTVFSHEEMPKSQEAVPQPPGLVSDQDSCFKEVDRVVRLIKLPVRLCLAFLFAKVFTIEALVSCTSALTKNRYGWHVQQVGTLGFINGTMTVPLSIFVGYLSNFYQDRVLMTWLVAIGSFGLFLLIDFSDLMGTPTSSYNQGHPLAVSPPRYVTGYFLAFCSIQAFEGVIGSMLSKVIPTALASGTLNSGLLATLVDTLGRGCGDTFIFFVGSLNLRQLMNMLFIPACSIMVICLITIRRFHDVLSV